VVKKRFSDDQIAKLLAKPWWKLTDAEIQLLIPNLCSDRIDELICALYS
jgi:hypothetical protein